MTGSAMAAKAVAAPMPFVYVDNEEALGESLRVLLQCRKIAFDTEGVDLGREGELTVMTLRGLDDGGGCVSGIAYVVDVRLLGNERVFSLDQKPSFRDILENPDVTKFTFDCRRDSDALQHQFRVTLQGVLDLQVYEQAIRIQNGELPPERCPWVMEGGVPLLSGMVKVAERVLPHNVFQQLEQCSRGSITHKEWGERPLTEAAIAYAAKDVHTIAALLAQMDGTEVSESLMAGVKMHSARYENQFRNSERSIPRKPYSNADKELIMEELPIVDWCDLDPTKHPRRAITEPKTISVQKWNDATDQLVSHPHDSNHTPLFNKVMSIVQHDHWYTAKARMHIQELALKYPFTKKQQKSLQEPPEMQRRYESSEDYDCY